MNNTLALTKIIDIFYSLAMGNKMVNDYFFGTSYNINSANERRYPLIAIEPTNSTVTSSSNNGGSRMNVYLHTFNVYSLDRIAKGDGNFNELLNDCQFILQTFITQIDQHPYYTDLGMMFDGDINLQPVFEVEDDNVNGWMATITIKTPNKYTPCNTPQIPILSWTTSYANGTNQLRLVGPPGSTGPAATIQVGSVSTGGSVPTVTNVGNSFSAIFDFTFPASSGGGGNLQQTLTLGNTASLGFQLYDSALIDLNDNFGNTNTLGSQNIVISNNVGDQIDINTQGIVVGSTSSSVSLQKDNIIKLDTITGAETILEFNQTSAATRTIRFPDNDGTVALLSDITGGNLQQTLTLGNTSSLSIDLFDSNFTSTKYSGETSTISGGSVIIQDLASNQVQMNATSILLESTLASITINDDSITKTDNSDGRYTELIFDQTTAGQVNTITIPDNTGTVALLSDIPTPTTTTLYWGI